MKILVKMEKIIVWIQQVELEPLPRGFSSGTQGTCITLLVPLRNVISERRRLQNKNGEKSGEKWRKWKSGENSRENGENYSYDTTTGSSVLECASSGGFQVTPSSNLKFES